MIKQLSYQDAVAMIKGSSIYSTGGGFAYENQKKMFKQLFQRINRLSLISLADLSDTDYVCTSYAIGSSHNTNVDLTPQLKKGLNALKKLKSKTPKAIFAGETNIDIVTAHSASSLGLPLLDADSTGGRAVPEIQMDNFVIAGEKTTPIVIVSPDEKVTILKEVTSLNEVEKKIRSISKQFPAGLVAVLDHFVQVKKAKKVLTQGIFSRSLRLGKLIEKHENDSNILALIQKEVKAHVIIDGKVTKNNVINHEGFLEGIYEVSDRDNIARVYVKNENIILWGNNKPLVISPDSIITIDANNFLGIHNSKLKIGQHVIIMAAPATKLWQSVIGKKLFQPSHFGFSFDETQLTR